MKSRRRIVAAAAVAAFAASWNAANALGLVLSPSLLLRADEVIE
jgi:hypothetical protein